MKLKDFEVLDAGNDIDIMAAGDNAAIIFDQFLRALQLPDNESVSKLLRYKLESTQFQRHEIPFVKAYYDYILSRQNVSRQGLLRFIKPKGR